MNLDPLYRRLQIWKYILFMNLGASIILFVQAILHYLDTGILLFPMSWYGAWLIIQLATFLPGFVLLWGKHWIQIPLPERLNTIFGYFAVAWFTLLPVGITIGRDISESFNFFLLGCGTAIVIGYWTLRRRGLGIQNEIFP